MTILGGLAPWFGAKRTLAKTIVAELGPHRAYWEPFCGSCAVLFAKPPISHETVNDLHGDLVNLAMVLASPKWLAVNARTARILPCEELYFAYRRDLKATPADPPATPRDVTMQHVDRAVTFLVVSWMGLNGMAGARDASKSFTCRWTASGGRWGWARVAESIPAWHQRLRHVCILNRDAFKILAQIEDEPGTVFYVDPPYIDVGRRYVHSMDLEEHRRLAELLGRFKHVRIVLSAYEHPTVRALYPTWTVRDVTTTKALSQSVRRGSTREDAPEILLINGPSLIQGELF